MIRLNLSEIYGKERKSLCVEAPEKNNRPLFLNECDESNSNQVVGHDKTGVVFLPGTSEAESVRCVFYKKNGSLKIFNYCDNFEFGTHVEEDLEEDDDEEDEESGDGDESGVGDQYGDESEI